MNFSNPSPSLIERVVYGVLSGLAKNGGQMRLQDLIAAIEPSLDLTAHDRELTESGSPRWINVVHYYSIPLAHAGFITKNRGEWFLTDEGAAAVKLGSAKAYNAMKLGEQKWKRAKVGNLSPTPAPAVDAPAAPINSFLKGAEGIRDFALDGIRRYLSTLNPYEFQDLVAALLRAMGYFTPYVAPRGKDGGVDIIANEDALGVSGTRIKVQVKHTPDAVVSSSVVQKLVGTLSHSDEVGLVVTSGGFSPDARSFARGCSRRVGLLSGDDVIELWQKFYPKLTEDDRALLPLVSVMFLAKNLAPDEVGV